MIERRSSTSERRGATAATEDGLDAHVGHVPAPSVHGLALQAIRRLASSKSVANDDQRLPIDEDLQHEFLEHVLQGDTAAGLSVVEAAVRDGHSYQRVADTLFANAARRLGAAWETDDLSFIEVSLGMVTILRIHSMVRRMHPATNSQKESIRFATLQGQKHTLGVIIATEAFRQQGYHVTLILDADPEAVVKDVEARQVSLLGLTAGRDDRLSDIRTVTTRIKNGRNPPAIILGGAAAVDLAASGTSGLMDCVATDLHEALEFARNLRLEPK
ncbi:cobalamin B12-binding domain-containing protein [Lutimaribacter saemankumensis]|uniref:cobalamin B12-binding domain-containing protein n=1 Tax=Lutimaribacter saemankumensis TaxID=490829 RepID=UPI00111378F2|nr:cobalamin B12-binding domain-containing protein [Lutimaribacter saemankumensis]